MRQNILFGQAMDRPRYNTVVRRCALDRDFALFPQGDKTVVGERGVSLSGGDILLLLFLISLHTYVRYDVHLTYIKISLKNLYICFFLSVKCVK